MSHETSHSLARVWGEKQTEEFIALCTDEGRRKLIHFVMKLGAQHDLAQDMVHEGIMQAWAHRELYRSESTMSTWLHEICRCRLYSCLRKKKPALMTDLFWNRGQCRSSPHHHVMSTNNETTLMDQDETLLTLFGKCTQSTSVTGALSREFMDALRAQLSSEHFDVLRLRYLEGYSQEEVSRMLNIPLGTAKSRIYHARQNALRIAEDMGYDAPTFS